MVLIIIFSFDVNKGCTHETNEMHSESRKDASLSKKMGCTHKTDDTHLKHKTRWKSKIAYISITSIIQVSTNYIKKVV